MIAFLGDDLSLARLRYVQALAIASIVLASIAVVTILIDAMQTHTDDTSLLVVTLFAIGLNVLWLVLARRGHLNTAMHGVIAMFVVGALVVPSNESPWLIAVLTIVTAATLAGPRVFVAANGLVLGRFVYEIVRLLLNPSSASGPDLYGVFAPLITLAFVSIVTRYFINVGQRTVVTSRATADLLQATSDVGQVVSQILDLDELLNRAVSLISARFKHYHVQIFLVNDTRDQAVLVASTGEIGQRLLERGHQLSVGSQSVIGQVVLRSAPVLVGDTDRNAVYYANELLRDTRAELALPIRDGNQTIGALDIQSVHANTFGKADLQALQIMADLLATAIRNARLFKQQAETVEENERLYRSAAGNLREIERLNQQLTGVAWEKYRMDTPAMTGVTLDGERLLPASEWSDPLVRAGREGRAVETGGEHKSVAVPVMLRGEVIGAIEVEPGMETSPETVEMVQAVAQRLALSLENARLYEATLDAAAQEQRINDIATRFQSVATVDELLRITLTELSETLGAEHSAIRLGRFAPQNGSAGHD